MSEIGLQLPALVKINDCCARKFLRYNCLTFDEHVENICKKLSKHVYLLSYIKDFLTYEAKQTFYNSYILPCIDYCCTVWGYTIKTNIDKIFTYQKRIL